MSVITDMVLDMPYAKVVSCYDNLEVLDELMPEFYDLKWYNKVTDFKGMLYGKQSFPWPLSHRDMCFHSTGVADPKNRGCMSLSTSIKDGTEYFGTPVPEPPKGLVRMHIKMGYNYF